MTKEIRLSMDRCVADAQERRRRRFVAQEVPMGRTAMLNATRSARKADSF